MNMKFLIAGLGSIGRRHLRNLLALGESDILLYRTHQSTLPDEELTPFPTFTKLADALAQKPDAVIVSNPTACHMHVALPAAMAGCHLLLEKPISDVKDEQVDALKRVADERGIRVLVGFQFRFHPVLMQLKQILFQGQLGRPYSFRCHWGEYLPNWHPWEDYRDSYAARNDLGGGVVNTLSHPLDYVRWLFGEVQSLTAVTGHVSDLEINVEDVAEITLNFVNGTLGSIHLDYYQRPPSHWLEINCEKGLVRWDNAVGAARVYHVDKGQWQDINRPAEFERNDLFLAEMQHFINLIDGRAESRCDLTDGIQALALTQAVHAASEKRGWVNLPSI
jgi:predicted dehydrogenase